MKTTVKGANSPNKPTRIESTLFSLIAAVCMSVHLCIYFTTNARFKNKYLVATIYKLDYKCAQRHSAATRYMNGNLLVVTVLTGHAICANVLRIATTNLFRNVCVCVNSILKLRATYAKAAYTNHKKNATHQTDNRAHLMASIEIGSKAFLCCCCWGGR